MNSKSNTRLPPARTFGQWLALVTALILAGAAHAQIQVAFLAPDQPGENPFWTRTIAAMEAAADDLGIDLRVAYSKSNTYSNRKDGEAMLAGDDKPDYFLTGYWPGATASLLAYAEKQGVKTFVFNSGVPEEERAKAGEPRQKYPSWIGQMTPDDERVGHALADALLTRARAVQGTDQALRVLGLGGLGDSKSEQDRRHGLERRIAEAPDAALDQFVYAAWSRDTAYQSLLDVLNPGTSVSVIWCDGDSMALGAVDAVRELNRVPGRDVIIGGIGWDKQVIESVAAGDIEAAMGGHFLEGAWVLALLYDYHHGRDFADELGVEFHSRMQAITSDNAQSLLKQAGDVDLSAVDFTRYSKRHNPQLKAYQWPLRDVLDQLTRSGGE